jgi:hypothetical protein
MQPIRFPLAQPPKARNGGLSMLEQAVAISWDIGTLRFAANPTSWLSQTQGDTVYSMTDQRRPSESSREKIEKSVRPERKRFFFDTSRATIDEITRAILEEQSRKAT